MTESEFSFPQLSLGTEVVVSLNPSMQDFCFGWIIKAKNRSADILAVTPAGFSIRFDCWHKDDPRRFSQPEKFYNIFQAPDSMAGLFDLSESEKDRRGLLARMSEVENSLRSAQQRLLRDGVLAPKGRGRPPKHLPREVESGESSDESRNESGPGLHALDSELVES